MGFRGVCASHLADDTTEMNLAPLLGHHRGFFRRQAGLGPGYRVDKVGPICTAKVLLVPCCVARARRSSIPESITGKVDS